MFARAFFRLSVIIGALPVTLNNGTTADATQVMADLNWIVNQVNANASDLTNAALTNANNNFTVVQSGVAATQPANFPIASQVQNDVFNTLSSTLGTNVLTARVSALPLSAYAVGQVFTFQPAQRNTSSVTMNIDGLGSAVIKTRGQILVGGELGSGAAMVRVSAVASQPVLDLIGVDQLTFQPQAANLVYAGPTSGAASPPSFRPLIANDGLSWVLLSTQTAAVSANLSFTSVITDLYTDYAIVFTHLQPATDNVSLYLTASVDNGASFLAGANYQYTRGQSNANASGFATVESGGTAQLELANALSNVSGENLSGVLYFSRGPASNFYATFSLNWLNITPTWVNCNGSGGTVNAAVNALRIAMSAGNITSGKVRLFGIRN